MRLRINGEDQVVEDGLTVTRLLEVLEIRAERVAVERNRLVVRRATWAETPLAEGDELEILTFVGGG